MDERLEAPEYLSGLRRLHQPDKGGRCPQCGPGEGRWPCTVAALLEHIDAQDAELARLRAQDVVAQLRAIDDVMMQAGIEPQGSPRLNVLELIRQWQYEAEQYLACGRELDRERQRVHDLTVALDENRKMTIAANQAAGKAEAELARLRAAVTAELRAAQLELTDEVQE